MFQFGTRVELCRLRTSGRRVWRQVLLGTPGLYGRLSAAKDNNYANRHVWF